MRKVLVIGIGCGDPEQITVQAVRALNRADVIFLPDKGQEKQSLAAMRQEICRRYLERPVRTATYAVPSRRIAGGDYGAGVVDWHAALADIHEGLIAALDLNETGAFLVWGDPSLYDSTLRILEQVQSRGRTDFTCEVIPGISSLQALAARHAIILNDIGGTVHVTTGRRLAEKGVPEEADSIAVMLDGQQAFASVDRDAYDIYWAVNLGLDSEALIAGPLAERVESIRTARSKAREKEGWAMDVYLLRRR
jgi:precorrin-6A synthase